MAEASNRAYLALGSNVCPEENLPAAVTALAEYGRVVAVSQVWESAPVGFTEQPNFLNAALLLETLLNAKELCLQAIPGVEQQLKRVRDPSNKNGPRTIDVDLALFNHETLQIGHHRIPDPDIVARAFVAVPLAELDPGYVHPDLKETLESIAQRLKTQSPSMRLRSDVVLPIG